MHSHALAIREQQRQEGLAEAKAARHINQHVPDRLPRMNDILHNRGALYQSALVKMASIRLVLRPAA